MLEKNTLVKVKNVTNARTGYVIPDLGNFHRLFMPGETKEITFDELEKLSFTPGGRAIISDFLMIDNEEALKELLGEVEPEYFYTKEDVENILNTGSIEQLMDFLDFAPEGLISLMKDLAIIMEIPDIRKREAIKEKTGFDITKAILINHESMSEEEMNKTENVRRTAPIEHKDESEKRTPPKYKVVR